uniref:hypothetical protein n=1 Tax=Azospirillum argentinense TaxID=2970906 RepID=UPI001586B21E|nr:hypothetical protein [Azospirillum argentinense]
MPTSSPDKQNVASHCLDVEVEAMRALIDQRRTDSFVDLHEGEAQVYRMLKLKKQARGS